MEKINAFKELPPIDRKYYEILYNEALEMVKIRAWKSAIMQLSFLLNMNYRKTDVLYHRSICLEKQKLFKDAMGDIETALLARPTESLLLCQKTRLLRLLDRLNEAELLINSVLIKQSNLPEALVEYAEICYALSYKKERYDDNMEEIGKKSCESAMFLNPEFVEAYITFAKHFCGDRDNSMVYIKKAIDLEPDNPDHYLLLADMQYNDKKARIKNILKAIELGHTNLEWHIDRVAYAYEELGDIPAAISFLSKMAERFPDDSRIYSVRASMYSLTNNLLAELVDRKNSLNPNDSYNCESLQNLFSRMAENVEHDKKLDGEKYIKRVDFEAPDTNVPPCSDCGSLMVRNGADFKCLGCNPRKFHS